MTLCIAISILHPITRARRNCEITGFAYLSRSNETSHKPAPMATVPASIGFNTPVRYRGFVLIPQADLTWLVRPERSPMDMLPFRAPASSVQDVKALVDWRLNQAA